jgi:ubiquinone/menaquinone biosynthesis C-methylase UbiE
MAGGADAFYGRLSVPRGPRLLNVGCGTWQQTLIALRKGADAMGVDIAENLVERARERARVGAWARFEALPFADASFDVVTSPKGAMFAPRPEIVTGQILRVCRPGGIAAVANWTEQGFVGKMFKALSEFVAPSGMPALGLWGDDRTVCERFDAGVSSLHTLGSI